MDEQPYFALTTMVLALLIGVALWQFYTLVWGEALGGPSIGMLH